MRKFETVDEVKSVTAHEVINSNKYKPRARVRYKNQKKEKLEKIRKEERY
jgi:hypothetical protein